MGSPPTPAGGDPGSDFARLFAKHYRAVFGYVFCLVPNWSDADDIIQEVGVKLWQGFGKYRPGTDFVRWACTVAHYEVLSFRRRRKTRVQFDPDLLDQLAGPAAEAAGELEERRQALRECIDRLPAGRRRLVELVYQQGKSATDAARDTGRPAASVHTTLSLIRKQLRECVQRRLGRAGAETAENEAVTDAVTDACDRLGAGGRGVAELADLLRPGAAVRRAYVEHMVQTACLRFLADPRHPWVVAAEAAGTPPAPHAVLKLTPPPKARAGRPGRKTGRRPLVRWLVPLAAAAAVLVAVALWPRPGARPVVQAPEPAPPAPAPAPPKPAVAVATLVAADGAKWDVRPGDAAPQPGGRLAAGRALRLRAGLVKVAFDGGAEVLVEGPAGFTPEAAGRVLLADGVATATVRPGAEGFTVRTPAGEFVDLGTEFGVKASAAGSEAHVLVGQIEARAGGAAPPQRASRHEAVGLTRPGVGPQTVAFDAGRFPAPGALDGDKPVLREFWLGLDTRNNSLDDLLALPRFTAGRPDGRGYLSAFEVRPRKGPDRQDRYGSRLTALVRAPQTGKYTFLAAGDDAVRVSLGTDPSPRGKRVIARVPSHTGFREWDAYPPQQVSAPVELKAGQSYYLEALHRQHGLGDHLSVGWTLPDGTKEWPIPGARLARVGQP